MTNDELENAFHGAAATIEKERNDVLPKSIVPTLFHYTSAQGLLGILASSKLWATNRRFLNDSSEVDYGMELYVAELEKREAQNDNPVIGRFLEITKQAANTFDGMMDVYLACFCEEDNLLNQWRDYSHKGGGYAIGFDFSGSDSMFRPAPDAMLRKVIYDEKLQRSLLRTVLDETIEALKSAAILAKDANTTVNLIAKASRFIRAEIADYLLIFKHPAFEIEKEWRLCRLTNFADDPQAVKFREGQFGMTPYLELSLHARQGLFERKLPIRQITFGPSLNPPSAKRALEMLVSAHREKLMHVEVTGSRLPVRL